MASLLHPNQLPPATLLDCVGQFATSGVHLLGAVVLPFSLGIDAEILALALDLRQLGTQLHALARPLVAGLGLLAAGLLLLLATRIEELFSALQTLPGRRVVIQG